MAGVEKGPVQSGPVDGCARGCGVCPFAGGGCPLRGPQTSEGTSVIKFSSFESLTRLNKLPAATIFFNASGEILMRLKEKICSICKEASSTCSHSKPKTGALSAA